MDTDSFTVHVKTENIYKDIADDAEARFGTSNFELERPLPPEKNKAKISTYLKSNNDAVKKEKNTRKGAIIRKPSFKDYENLFFSN